MVNKKVILDTNFLLIPHQFRVDIFDEIKRICDFPYRLYIIDKTITELNNIIEQQKGKDKEAAKIALELINKKAINIIITENYKSVDKLILKEAKNNDTIVATQDKILKEKLKKQGRNVIIMKQKKILAID